ncbi:cobalamin synthesis protein P47K [Natronococcus amylolyticus DSM 10524]|uniref:Cobalamin synthesis protein P47K n=1 Tax=Natronococcus amylolyticus DSM 10524 TaxID=1227497 RepID=L9WXJ9_9EURY|nr:GTP-binding protein [Natronococcus amylolyticus]ELY53916.1 cobalamin synthesis protein P47K [Natronococcus amylolyticus DSM 10524]
MTGPDDDRIPVTIVSGYLGAGKTTLVNHLLTNEAGHEIAVIVNDMGEVNIDADLIARENEEEGVIDLSNGCICCRLQGDLLEEARRLAESREFDYLLVESSGISEPIPVARVFLEGTEESEIDPTERFRLDTMVTVLDTYGFWKEFDAGATLPEGAQPDEERPLSEVLVEGVEFCDVLLLNKTDMVPDDVLEEIETVVDRLQPRAERVRTTYSEIDPDLVLGTGRFDFEDAKRSQGWKRELRGESHEHGDAEAEHEHGKADAMHDHDHEDHDHGPGHSAADLHGVSSFVFRADDPFRPDEFGEWLEEWDGSIIRAKGICHVAGREEVIGLSQAGPAVQAGPIGEWRPDDDRRTQLVFIGREMDEERIREELESMLVDPDERDGAESWADPFPL